VEPLHHRDPSLSLTDKYAVVLTEDDGFFGSGGAQQYVSVYDIAGDKGASHTNAFSGTAGDARGGPNPDLGDVGTLMGATINGDYIILGGNAGTAVFKIDASGNALTISKVTDKDTTGGNHWFKDNGSYVLESKSGNGKVQVWKWNGANTPTAVGMVNVNGNDSGSVQALCFDPDNPATAYFYQKAGTDAGKAWSVNLADTSLTKTELFSLTHWVFSASPGRGSPAEWFDVTTIPGGIWTIEKQKSGNDNYYVLSGSYQYRFSGANNDTTVGAVFTIKNPATGDSFGGTYTAGNTPPGVVDATEKVSLTTFTAPWGTAVRTLKTFKSNSGDIYFAAKNYTVNGAASNYKLVLEQLN
jgi:hypothetical protein